MRRTMEPKVIKEEAGGGEKETAGFIDAPMRTRSSKGGSVKERCKTPDSPEGARLPSPTQSSPARHINGTNSPPASTNGSSGAADSLTPPPPLPASAALSVEAQPFGGSYATCITRPLVKVKRFLSTLVQFGNDIGPDIGERVRTLVLNLVSSNLSIEEFHHSLQEVTNFPLRPFVLPFLRAHLPLLQREIHGLARNNKQSPLQYVRTHDHVVLDPAHSPTEPSEIFLSNESHGMKRRASDSACENGINGQPAALYQDMNDSSSVVPAKRLLTSQNAFLLTSHPQNLLLPNTSGVPNSHFFDYAQQNPAYAVPHRSEDVSPEACRVSSRGDEEWKNIHVMLNCILSMVEKTKRALTILQQRNNQDLTNEWLRKQDVGVDLKKAANEIMMQAVRQTEDRVAEVKRRAEEAVNDVKRQAVIELQKAVTTAETKANELVAAERAKMDKLLAEARKQPEETAEADVNRQSSPQPAPSQQNSCWNCGRKAHETCSGCSMARYCGPFCQHKDWENHHQVCSKEKMRPLRSATPSTTSGAASLQPPLAPGIQPLSEPSSVKFKK